MADSPLRKELHRFPVVPRPCDSMALEALEALERLWLMSIGSAHLAKVPLKVMTIVLPLLVH